MVAVEDSGARSGRRFEGRHKPSQGRLFPVRLSMGDVGSGRDALPHCTYVSEDAASVDSSQSAAGRALESIQTKKKLHGVKKAIEIN